MRTIEIKMFDDYLHYYIDNHYLGMFVLSKGEISDHRAIIRKNKLKITSENLLKTLTMSVYALLNHYLIEKDFINIDLLEERKKNIADNSKKILQETADKIIEKNILIKG